MEDHRGRKGKLKGEKSERGTNHERLWTPGNKLRVSEGRGEGDGVAGRWVLRRARVVMSTGCYMQPMNH